MTKVCFSTPGKKKEHPSLLTDACVKQQGFNFNTQPATEKRSRSVSSTPQQNKKNDPRDKSRKEREEKMVGVPRVSRSMEWLNKKKDEKRGVAFLFAPVGWQRIGMGRALYEREKVFRKVIDDVSTLWIRFEANPADRQRM